MMAQTKKKAAPTYHWYRVTAIWCNEALTQGTLDTQSFTWTRERALKRNQTHHRENLDRRSNTEQRNKTGATGRIRTSDPRFRRPMLYPAELRLQAGQTIVVLHGMSIPFGCRSIGRVLCTLATSGDTYRRYASPRFSGERGIRTLGRLFRPTVA